MEQKKKYRNTKQERELRDNRALTRTSTGLPEYPLWPLPWRHGSAQLRARIHAHPVACKERAHTKWRNKKGAKGGGCLTFWVEFLLQCGKCHIIGPDASINIRQSIVAVNSKRIITSLQRPLCLAPLELPSLLFLHTHTHTENV